MVMDSTTPPSPPRDGAPPALAASLLALAPLYLPNYRQDRYQGDDVCIPLTRLTPGDQASLRDLYDQLNALLHTIADTSTDDAGKWRGVVRWTQQQPLDRLIDQVREIGMASHGQNGSGELSKAMHDVRGGGLSALLGRLQLLDHLSRTEDQLKTLFILARDHLKIMRSAATGLDDARRDADRRPKSHDMALMLNKWHRSVLSPPSREQPLRMIVDCRYAGTLTECCLESAAVDRIFYNLANNARRHAVGDRVTMTIFPVPEAPGDGLRFVLCNEVGEEDAAFLGGLARSGGNGGAGESGDTGKAVCLDLPALFAPAVSSTGSGFGLTVVADFVSSAFGLSNSQEALRERYAGAKLEGLTFRVWFHWPLAHTAHLRPQTDDFHRPQDSLDEP